MPDSTPPPSPEMLAALRSRLEAGSSILSFEAFMDCVLYHPVSGYYTRQRQRIGRSAEADFYTASSLGGVFARLVLAAVCKRLGKAIGSTTFVEIGPESERGIHTHLAHSPFKEVRLVRAGDPFELEGPCLVFSNELFDAQPFRRFIRTADGWHELGVSITEDGLRWTSFPPRDSLPDLPVDARVGYLIDWPSRAHELLQAISRQPWNGLFLAFDYGLTRETVFRHRPAGTARTYSRHQLGADLLQRPGEVDITCHLIWEELEAILARNRFTEIRIQTQEAFFMHHAESAIGEIMANAQPGLSPEKQTLMELLHPDNMGHKFQVLQAIRRES